MNKGESTTKMVSTSPAHREFNMAGLSRIICNDNLGCYVTKRALLNNGKEDPNRTSERHVCVTPAKAIELFCLCDPIYD